MRATLFKAKRNGKESKQYVLRVYRRPGERPVQIPLHVSLKENAEKRKREILLGMEKEEAGLTLPKHQWEAAKLNLIDHVKDYVAHMEQKGLRPMHIQGEETACHA